MKSQAEPTFVICGYRNIAVLTVEIAEARKVNLGEVLVKLFKAGCC